MSIQFSHTISPSMIVGCDLDNCQFFRIHSRTGALVGKFGMNISSAALVDVIALDTEAQAIPSKFGPNHYVKLRDVFIDDKNGSFILNIDYIHDKGVDPVFSEVDIKLLLGDGTVRYEGQGQWVNVSIKTGNFSSDYFSPVSDQYYK